MLIYTVKLNCIGVAATAQLCSGYTCEGNYPGPLNTLGIMGIKEAKIPGDCNRQGRKHKWKEHEQKWKEE